MKTIAIAVLIILAATNAVMAAQGCRCPGGYIAVGDHKAEILNKCDQPDRIFPAGEDRPNKKAMRYSEDWEYRDLGGGMVRIFTFRGSTLMSIGKFRK